MVLLRCSRYAGAVGSRILVRRWAISRTAIQARAGSGPPSRWEAGRARFGPTWFREAFRMGSVVKKRRKRMAKKKHRKLLRKTRVQRRRLGK